MKNEIRTASSITATTKAETNAKISDDTTTTTIYSDFTVKSRWINFFNIDKGIRESINRTKNYWI